MPVNPVRRWTGPAGAKAVVAVSLLVFVAVACGRVAANRPAEASTRPPVPGERTGVVTTARASISEAVREHFGLQSTPIQPLDFPHDVHVAKGIGCQSFCHATVAQGPVAGLPGIKTCLVCHGTVAVDRPRIQELNRRAAQGLDLPWRRVVGYSAQAHVRFSHAPHIRASVDCATCHGPVAQQTVAQRNLPLTMGFCVNCHRANEAPDDCLTCHK